MVSFAEARRIADDQGLDLVEVSPTAKPPVIKLIDYGRFKYEQQKRANEQKKKTAAVQLKEIQFRPNIEAGDLGTKLTRATKFLEQGDKIKMVMQFRGREMAYREAGMEKFKGIIEMVVKLGAIVESAPKSMGNRFICIMAPDKKVLNQKAKDQKRLEKLEALEAAEAGETSEATAGVENQADS